jgi:hypothetical protein
MNRNVGSKERYARLVLSAAAGAAAARTSGWPRKALGTIAAAGLTTGISGYCPINQAVGRDSLHGRSPLDQGLRDTEIRRETAVSGALGIAPGGREPKVTPQSDLFSRSDESLR